jgi:rod shape-determining protein MreC
LSGKLRRIAVVVVVVVIFSFLSLPIVVSRSVKEAVTGVFTPVFSLSRSIGDKVHEIWVVAFHSNNVVRESLQKERETSKLRAELALAREKIRELTSLNSQLAAAATSGFEVLPARVIGREPDSWYQTLLIDRGVRDGVGRGTSVLYGDNFIGRVIEAGGKWSRVRLILDPQSAIPAMALDGEVTGLVVGAGLGQLKMTYIEHTAKVEVGDVVATAHLGKVLSVDEAPLPQGLIIGKVASVSKEEEGLYQSANLESAVGFRNLSEVLVVVPK